MTLQSLKSQISAYQPFNEREKLDQAAILKYLEQYSDLLDRSNQICHFTSSCWILNPSRTKALMLQHNLYKKWMWPGGHADGDSDLLHVAIKEAQEETSLQDLKVLDENIFSLEIFSVPAHIRKGEAVAPHLHLNCSFVFEADDAAPFKIKSDENSEIRWMTFAEVAEEIARNTTYDNYHKLIVKTQQTLSK